MHHLKMVMVKTLNHPQPLPHIRPLWLSKELSSQIFHIPCEVDTGTSSNILPLYKENALLEQISSWDNRQWIWTATMTAQLRILDPVLCTFIMARKHTKSHVKWQTAKVTWSWAGSNNANGIYMLASQRSSSNRSRPKWIRLQKSLLTSLWNPPPAEPVIPVGQEYTDKKITIGGKTHLLPTTKEYLMKEYSDKFKGT